MKLNNLLAYLSIKLITFYQEYISPVLSKKITCRFHPTCSEYAKLAIEKNGAIKGWIKATKRYFRCNPSNLESCVDYP